MRAWQISTVLLALASFNPAAGASLDMLPSQGWALGPQDSYQLANAGKILKVLPTPKRPPVPRTLPKTGAGSYAPIGGMSVNQGRQTLAAAMGVRNASTVRHVVPWEFRNNPFTTRALQGGMNFNGPLNGIQLSKYPEGFRAYVARQVDANWSLLRGKAAPVEHYARAYEGMQRKLKGVLKAGKSLPKAHTNIARNLQPSGAATGIRPEKLLNKNRQITKSALEKAIPKGTKNSYIPNNDAPRGFKYEWIDQKTGNRYIVHGHDYHLKAKGTLSRYSPVVRVKRIDSGSKTEKTLSKEGQWVRDRESNRDKTHIALTTK